MKYLNSTQDIDFKKQQKDQKRYSICRWLSGVVVGGRLTPKERHAIVDISDTESRKNCY